MQPPKRAKPNDLAYLDTVHRHVLDFDFEKMCLVTLSTTNVYCCLVCGKYLQGKAPGSQAYLHSINEDHHVFVNMENQRFYVLPDNLEITSERAVSSLQDIKNAINPVYTKEDIAKYVEIVKGKDLAGKAYDSGFIGLNNIGLNDYANVVLQLLAHIPPLRDYFLEMPINEATRDNVERKAPLVARFGLLVRKLWSAKLFRNHISPHEILLLVDSMSKKRFSTASQASPKDFLLWMINQLHVQLVKSTKQKNTVLSLLRGSVHVTTTQLRESENSSRTVDFTEEDTTSSDSPFWFLHLALPPTPLFQSSRTDALGREIGDIPQVSIYELLAMYNGSDSTQTGTSLKKYTLLSLPKFLLIYFNRGLDDGGRGNPAVVKYPDVLNLEPYIGTKASYKLIGNITHTFVPGEKLDQSDDKHKWSVSLPKPDGSWVTITDLDVVPCQRELLFLKETYIQLWEKID